jgi:hypothetical protein
MKSLFISLILLTVTHAIAQDPWARLEANLETQRLAAERGYTEALVKLRDAKLALREVRRKSCAARNDQDCLLADLSSAGVMLLDVEARYRNLRSQVQDENRKNRYKQVSESAEELRRKVDELIALIEKADQ